MPPSREEDNSPATIPVERIQTGVRLEKQLVKVLKALAEHKDMTLGELLEGVLLHALEGKQPFSKDTLALISQLRTIYGMQIDASSSHRLRDKRGA